MSVEGELEVANAAGKTTAAAQARNDLIPSRPLCLTPKFVCGFQLTSQIGAYTLCIYALGTV